MTCCPTCGQALPEHGIHFDAAAGIVVSGGEFVVLPRREATILEFLWAKPGRYFLKEQLYAAVYSIDETPSDVAVESHVSKLRKKVRPLGIHIRSERFKGYQLTIGGRS